MGNEDTVLGKKAGYKAEYDPSLLVFVPREPKRNDIGYQGNDVDFDGVDVWNAYEFSYLDGQGKPHVKIGKLVYSAETENIVESKSLKLYFNSFNMSKFKNESDVEYIVRKDLMRGLNDDELDFILMDADHIFDFEDRRLIYQPIDGYDISPETYVVDKSLLKPEIQMPNIAEDNPVLFAQTLRSNLLKSNCLVTHQPDWASVYLTIVPRDRVGIDEQSLLKYIVSFRQHNEFHEQCVERIFHDVKEAINPLALEVFAKYTRRGGIDINPYRYFDETGEYIKGKSVSERMKMFDFKRDVRQ